MILIFFICLLLLIHFGFYQFPNFSLRVLSEFFNWEIIKLKDSFGDTYLTKRNKENIASVYWQFGDIKKVKLLSDGTIENGIYIKSWEIIRNKKKFWIF